MFLGMYIFSVHFSVYLLFIFSWSAHRNGKRSESRGLRLIWPCRSRGWWQRTKPGQNQLGLEMTAFSLSRVPSHDSLDAVLRHPSHEFAELWTILNDFSIINGMVSKTKTLRSVDFLSIGQSPLGQWSSPKKVPK